MTAYGVDLRARGRGQRAERRKDWVVATRYALSPAIRRRDRKRARRAARLLIALVVLWLDEPEDP